MRRLPAFASYIEFSHLQWPPNTSRGSNARIAQRHLFSIAFAAFFREQFVYSGAPFPSVVASSA